VQSDELQRGHAGLHNPSAQRAARSSRLTPGSLPLRRKATELKPSTNPVGFFVRHKVAPICDAGHADDRCAWLSGMEISSFRPLRWISHRGVFGAAQQQRDIEQAITAAAGTNACVALKG